MILNEENSKPDLPRFSPVHAEGFTAVASAVLILLAFAGFLNEATEFLGQWVHCARRPGHIQMGGRGKGRSLSVSDVYCRKQVVICCERDGTMGLTWFDIL